MSGPVAALRLDDPFAFANAAGEQSGAVAISGLQRLRDRLSADTGQLAYRVCGGKDARERPLLKFEIAGTLRVRCDHCLEALDYRLSLRSAVLLAHPGHLPEEDADPETPEWIEAGRELDLQELLEDEILLGMPFSIRHEQGCVSAKARSGMGSAENSPFASLAALKVSERSDKDQVKTKINKD